MFVCCTCVAHWYSCWVLPFKYLDDCGIAAPLEWTVTAADDYLDILNPGGLPLQGRCTTVMLSMDRRPGAR